MRKVLAILSVTDFTDWTDTEDSTDFRRRAIYDSNGVIYLVHLRFPQVLSIYHRLDFM